MERMMGRMDERRVTWISIGGAVFFGALEKAKSVIATVLDDKEE